MSFLRVFLLAALALELAEAFDLLAFFVVEHEDITNADATKSNLTERCFKIVGFKLRL